jgi:hypothetical protein
LFSEKNKLLKASVNAFNTREKLKPDCSFLFIKIGLRGLDFIRIKVLLAESLVKRVIAELINRYFPQGTVILLMVFSSFS